MNACINCNAKAVAKDCIRCGEPLCRGCSKVCCPSGLVCWGCEPPHCWICGKRTCDNCHTTCADCGHWCCKRCVENTRCPRCSIYSCLRCGDTQDLLPCTQCGVRICWGCAKTTLRWVPVYTKLGFVWTCPICAHPDRCEVCNTYRFEEFVPRWHIKCTRYPPRLPYTKAVLKQSVLFRLVTLTLCFKHSDIWDLPNELIHYILNFVYQAWCQEQYCEIRKMVFQAVIRKM